MCCHSPQPPTVNSRAQPPRAGGLPFSIPRSACITQESGFIFISTLLLLSLLIPLSLSAIARLQTDLHISRNLLSSVGAFWIARAGTAVGKDWLENNGPEATFPVTLGPHSFANGSYSVTIDRLGRGKYRLSALGQGTNAARHLIEEIVRVPDFTPAGVVTSDGDGLHPDFDDASGGTGRRIPDFSIDGRNHASSGGLSASCPAISPFATARPSARSDLLTALNSLKHGIVERANSFCRADGGNAAGRCTPGLFWVRGPDSLPRFHSSVCEAADPSCFLNLDLSASALRASGLPPELHTPLTPYNHGPFAPGTAPLVHSLSPGQRDRLRTSLLDIVGRLPDLPAQKILFLRSSLGAGTHTYGTPDEPRITWIEDGGGPLDLDGGAVVQGAGLLIISRAVRLGRASFNWRGLVLIVDDGDFRVADAEACGHILGAVVIRDNAIPNQKFDLDRVQANGRCRPFTVSYSCEAVHRALSLFMRTVSFRERFNE